MMFGATQSESTASAHSGATVCERTKRALQQIPMHLLRTMGTCVLPAIAGMVPILIAGLHAKRMATELPHATATYLDLELLTEVRSGTSLALETVKSAASNIFGYMSIGAVLLALMARRVVLPSIRIIVPVCCLCSVAVWQLSIYIVPATGSTFFWDFSEVMRSSIYTVAVFTPLRSIGRRVGDSTFWWKFSLYHVVGAITGIFAIYPIIKRTPYLSDAEKVVHVIGWFFLLSTSSR
jgi:hypothetical protein